MDPAEILFEKREGVATITLNRPDRNNAFTIRMADELQAAWHQVTADPEVVCTILTAAGERSFCTGMDLSDVADGSARDTGDMGRDEAPWFRLTAIQNRCWKPVVTAVNGMVCGGGLHFIADADLILCAEHATFFDNHVRVGLVAGLEPVGLTRRIPLEAVLRMSFLGGAERMNAQRAYELGLVGEIVPKERLLERAWELAAAIARHSPTALAQTKRAIWESLDVGLDEGIGRAWEVIREHNKHPDIEEGAKAFVEKRKPRWEPFTG